MLVLVSRFESTISKVTKSMYINMLYMFKACKYFVVCPQTVLAITSDLEV